MKLLFDQNLSFKLCHSVADLFPESTHVGFVGLAEVSDRALWDYAKTNGFTIVSQDADFAEMATLLGAAQGDLVAFRQSVDGGEFDNATPARGDHHILWER